MADTTVPVEEGTEENVVAGEVNDLSESENQNVDQPSSVQISNLKVPDDEELPGSGAVLQRTIGPQKSNHQISVGSPESAEQILKGKSAGGDSEKYGKIEDEHEQLIPVDGEVILTAKSQDVIEEKDNEFENKEIGDEEIVEVNVEGDYQQEELNEHFQSRTVSEKEEVERLQYNLVKEENFFEKEEEYEEEEVDETGEIRVIKKTRLAKVAIEESESFEEAEEEYDSEETDENNQTVIVKKKRMILIPKQTLKSSKESIHEMISKEKSEAEESVSEEGEEVKEDELDKEETSKGEVEKEQEEGGEKDSMSVGEKKSVASMSSAEVLLSQEKLAMAQQFEILTKLRTEHTALKRKHLFLNNKLVQYFRKQKMDHVFAETKEDPGLEQQYLKKLMIFYETNQQMTEEKLKINTEWEAQRNINEELAEKVKKGWEELFSHKREIAAKLIDPKTGRTVPCNKAIEDLLNRQEAQLNFISECRLAQIKLKRRIEAKRVERQMQHEGKEFNLMDYEKLSSLKEYYMDKITERDIEIEEVSQKLAAMDDTLSHVKEQLQKKDDELMHEQERLQRMNLELNDKRAKLNALKSTRHKTEKYTAKIKQQSGLLAYPVLLKDYEEKTELLQLLMSQTEALKQAHRAAVLRIRKLREVVKRKTHERASQDMSPSTVTFSNTNNMF